MRALLLTALLLLSPGLSCAAEEQPTTHREAAQQLVELLVDTDVCLATCTDAASVQAALPKLRELAARAEQLKIAQSKLPEPTIQDYLYGQELLGAFNTAWQAVRAHIDRIEQAHLMSPELRDILRVTPPDSEHAEH